MSKSPLGPWDFKGLIMAEHANGCWTNHHSIVNYRGQWYLFYHHNPLSPRDDKRRSVQIEKLYFNADGTIREVKETMRGVGTNKAAPYPMPVAGGVQYVNIPVEIDTKTLSDIAAATEGNFYRATNNNELKQIYKDIDKLEKSKMSVTKFSKRYEAYMPFAIAAFVLLLLEILLRTTVLRRIP
jgi:hypothetical protein